MEIRGTGDVQVIQAIKRALRKVPRGHRALAPVIKVSRSDGFSIHEDTLEITACKQQVQRNPESVGWSMAHEFGHAYLLAHGGLDKWLIDYRDRMAAPYISGDFETTHRAICEAARVGVKVGFPSLYGRAVYDEREIFAEAYAMYLYERVELQGSCPELCAFLEEKVFC